MDGGAWWATVHGVTKSQTRLSKRLNLSSRITRGNLWGGGVPDSKAVLNCTSILVREIYGGVNGKKIYG